MASTATHGRWAKVGAGSLPFAVALQGAGLVVLAFFLHAPPAPHELDASLPDATWTKDNSPIQLASDAQVPADLLPERMAMPRFPDPKEPALRRQLVPSAVESEEAAGATRTLDALRVDTVTIETPAVVQVTLALPEGPEPLTPGSISLGRFGEELGRPGRTGRRGWEGIGAGGMGDGPRCHPTRGGILTGGGVPRHPTPPIIIERTLSYPR